MKIYSGKKRSVDTKDDQIEEKLYEFNDADEEEDEHSDENESDVDLNASDIEDEQIDDNIPDQKAWGKKRGHYYDADFVDADYDTYTKEEEDLAVAEEQEAADIQKRLAQQLNDIDCDLELFGASKKEPAEQQQQTETKLKVDFSNLDNRQKLQIFQRESPEFEGLISDFEHNLSELTEFYNPLLAYSSSKQSNLPIFKILQIRVSATNYYLTNLSFYLYMKMKKAQFKGHPVVKKLAQVKQLLTELDNKMDSFRPSLEELLEKIKENGDIICSKIDEVQRNAKVSKTETNDEYDDEANNELSEDDEQGDDNEDDEDKRRSITYQMAKNKGLTPYRKKENRNPRVKHRMKFRKALIRRKGAVRTVRKETKRYDGEISGIKATVKKGIKLK